MAYNELKSIQGQSTALAVAEDRRAPTQQSWGRVATTLSPLDLSDSQNLLSAPKKKQSQAATLVLQRNILLLTLQIKARCW